MTLVGDGVHNNIQMNYEAITYVKRKIQLLLGEKKNTTD